jgi:cyclophilin family peptidyl-prolyl cis-trans isomerase
MRNSLAILTLTLTLLGFALVATGAERISMETDMGTIVIELNSVKAPKTVANILAYVDSGHYEGVVFHRVIPGFMIQGGNMSPEMKPKATNPPIVNEATNGLKNVRGSLAMARTSVINSASSQFFINLKDNVFLDHKDTSQRGFGYAVFGKVVEGMAVVDKIAAVKTGKVKGFKDAPLTPVTIKKVTRVK